MRIILILLTTSLIMNCASQTIPNWAYDVPKNKENFIFLKKNFKNGGYFETASSSKTSEELSKKFAIKRALHKGMENKVWLNVESFVENFISVHLAISTLKYFEIIEKVKINVKNFDVDKLPFKEIEHKYFKDGNKYYTLVFISFKDIENILQNIILRECKQYNSDNNLDIDFIKLEGNLKKEIKDLHGNDNPKK